MSESINAEFEAYVNAELGDIAVVSEGRFISPKIQNYYKVWQHREAQLADANQAARWESDLASQALADLEPYRKDAERYQWLRGRIPGSAYRVAGIIYSEGGEGVDAAVDAAIAEEKA